MTLVQAELWRCICGCVNRDADRCDWCRRYRPDHTRERGSRLLYALGIVVAMLLFAGMLATAGLIGR